MLTERRSHTLGNGTRLQEPNGNLKNSVPYRQCGGPRWKGRNITTLWFCYLLHPVWNLLYNFQQCTACVCVCVGTYNLMLVVYVKLHYRIMVQCNHYIWFCSLCSYWIISVGLSWETTTWWRDVTGVSCHGTSFHWRTCHGERSMGIVRRRRAAVGQDVM